MTTTKPFYDLYTCQPVTASMSVLSTVGPKCTLAASHAAR